MALPKFFTDVLLKLALPKLEKILLAEVPIAPPSKTLLPSVAKLSGKNFDPVNVVPGSCTILPSGNFSLKPGDYLIPVMTYCMKSYAVNPIRQRFQLASLSGSKSKEIETLNRKAPEYFSLQNIQELSWSIQNGIPFEKMSSTSQNIIIKLMPELKKNLEEDLLTNLQEKWDSLAKFIPSAPSFENVKSVAVDQLGETGKVLQNILSLRKKILSEGANYDTFASTITSPADSEIKTETTSTPWSQIQKDVFARLLTDGGYEHPGVLQVRVNSPSGQSAEFNPYTLIADPGSGSMQPLAFSMIPALWIEGLALLR